jgi:hypothetical protein
MLLFFVQKFEKIGKVFYHKAMLHRKLGSASTPGQVIRVMLSLAAKSEVLVVATQKNSKKSNKLNLPRVKLNVDIANSIKGICKNLKLSLSCAKFLLLFRKITNYSKRGAENWLGRRCACICWQERRTESKTVERRGSQ